MEIRNQLQIIALLRETKVGWAYGAMIAGLIVGGALYLAWSHQATHDELQKRLQTRQMASVQQFENWMAERAQQARSWADRDDMRALLNSTLAQKQITPEQLDHLPLQQDMRVKFAAVQGLEGLRSYSLVSPAGQTLAAFKKEEVGKTHALWREPEFIAQMQSRGAAVSPLMTSGLPLKNGGVFLDGKAVTLYFGVPIKSQEQAQPTAYLILQIFPIGLMAEQGGTRWGATGMSYLADKHGRLHADRAWLNIRPEKYGLRGELFRGQPFLFARDPGHNVFEQPNNAVDRSSLPLTYSVKQLQQGNGQSLVPYRDHRGVEVVGGWTWSPILGLGVITEISAAEAFAPIAAAHQRVLIAALVLGILIVLNLIWRLRRSAQGLQIALIDAQAATQAKSRFLANISHEIRTPMNAVLGMMQLVLKGELTPRQREYLEKGRRASHYLLSILNDVLDFSKLEAGKLAIDHVEFELEQVLTHVKDLVSEQANAKGLEFVLDVDSAVPSRLCGDPLRLGQILINYAHNAVKFTEQGEIAIVVRMMEQTEHEVQLHFAVRDTGIGLTQVQAEQLFQAFTQGDSATARRYGGSGLGLVISKQLVELLQGQTGVESEPGKGATFWFSVRLRKADATSNCQTPTGPAALHSRRVLVVDDHEHAGAVMVQMLRNRGLATAQVTSGHAAIKAICAADARGESFDAVLLDWQMPEMDGMEVAQALRPLKLQRMPVLILVTAFGRQDVISSANAVGIRDVLVKPVTAPQLQRAIQHIWPAEEPVISPHAGSTPAPQASFLGMRLLLVDDDQSNQEIVAGLLEMGGVMVDVASHGEQALDMLKKTPDGTYTAVLMDIQMPVMDGLTTASEIRKMARFQALPVIVMTGMDEVVERQRGIEIGIDDYLIKPIHEEALWVTLGRCLSATLPVLPPQAELHAPACTSEDAGSFFDWQTDIRACFDGLEQLDAAALHDLRTLLGTINGHAGALQKNLAKVLDEQGQRDLEVIRKIAKQTAFLTTAWRTASAVLRRSLVRQNVDMHALVSQVLEEQEQRPGIQWQLGPLATVQGDLDLLRHVWRQLISNAVKYTLLTPTPVIQIRSQREASENVYVVQDNGVGFSMDTSEQLFEPLQRWQDAHAAEGAGLGLFMVRHIVARHGGRVWVQSRVGSGAAFYFSLPAVDA